MVTLQSPESHLAMRRLSTMVEPVAAHVKSFFTARDRIVCFSCSRIDLEPFTGCHMRAAKAALAPRKVLHSLDARECCKE